MKLALFPLHTVLFPGMALLLHIFEPRYLEMIGQCLTQGLPFGVVLIDSGREVGGPALPHQVGTVARITSVKHLADGRLHIEAVGQQRFRLLEWQSDHAFLTGTIEEFPLAGARDQPARQSARALVPWLARYLHLLGESAETQLKQPDLPHDPAGVGYLAAIVAQIPMLEKQALLATSTATELLQRERSIYRREISLLRAILSSDHARTATRFSPN